MGNFEKNLHDDHQMSVLVGWVGGPEVNMFEQVSSNGHQMSLTGTREVPED